ncbi:hypothetical protein AAC387_Pa11g1990 [Persea americana]
MIRFPKNEAEIDLQKDQTLRCSSFEFSFGFSMIESKSNPKSFRMRKQSSKRNTKGDFRKLPEDGSDEEEKKTRKKQKGKGIWNEGLISSMSGFQDDVMTVLPLDE